MEPVRLGATEAAATEAAAMEAEAMEAGSCNSDSEDHYYSRHKSRDTLDRTAHRTRSDCPGGKTMMAFRTNANTGARRVPVMPCSGTREFSRCRVQLVCMLYAVQPDVDNPKDIIYMRRKKDVAVISAKRAMAPHTPLSYDRCSACAEDPKWTASHVTTTPTDEREREYASRIADCEWEEANAPWFLWHWVRYHGYRWWG